MHLFVFRGERVLPHQLAADYFVEHLYLPATEDNADFRLTMGSCSARLKVITPLDEILIEVEDKPRNFALRLNYKAAMAPVGRPGGKHFTQLMKTRGEVVLDGHRFPIDGFYMRDRSWSYQRSEQPERTPPYRWMTGWFGDDCGFVVAWMDTGLIDGEEFGPRWNQVVGGKPRPVVRMDVRTLLDEETSMLVKGIELAIEDAGGEIHRISGALISMIPKMYWQNLLVHMHLMRLRYEGRDGHGDLMDTYSNHHIRALNPA